MRTKWMDENADLPFLDEKVSQIESFTEALSDGHVDEQELAAQQKRLVVAMEAVETQLDDDLHAKVTTLLVELTAFNVMKTLTELQEARATLGFDS